MTWSRNAVAALAGGVALLGSSGAALAANGKGDRTSRCEARLAAVAQKRGLSVAQLEAQIKARAIARIEAALRAGRISPERAGTLRERISTAELCKPARVVKVGLGARALLRPAAAYLGLDATQLGTQLPGTSLAALAELQGKSVEGLKAAMLSPAKARLSRAVESGRVTQAQADRRLALLEKRVDRLVARIFPAR